MKTRDIHRIILSILLLMLAGHAWSEEWQFRGFLPRGTAYYDQSSIRKTSDNVYQVWTVTIYNENGKKDAFALLTRHHKAPDNPEILTHESVLIEFDCKNEKYRIASINIFDEIGSILLSAPEINDKWREVVPKSINESLKNKICSAGKKTDQEKKTVP